MNSPEFPPIRSINGDSPTPTETQRLTNQAPEKDEWKECLMPLLEFGQMATTAVMSFICIPCEFTACGCCAYFYVRQLH